MEIRVRDLSLPVSEQRAELHEDTSNCPHAKEEEEPVEHSRNKGPWPHCPPSAHHPGSRPTDGHPAPLCIRTAARLLSSTCSSGCSTCLARSDALCA